ncbi:hypothetical protein EW145_g3273 [Phellinidium pouzarii]|uniref:Uncharacterized protein n=1 Tax=Phellinidium pouzarii TaxID=167371 RepID=A0A4S4L7Y0_9AGAM|nr:hypothetical protein EW145_g3273 [Phellinidium pouzarii]
MLSRDVAAIAAAIARRRDTRGKHSFMVGTHLQPDYGSTMNRPTPRSYSASRSNDRLQRVLEDANNDDGIPPAWVSRDGGDGSGVSNDVGAEVEDEDEVERYVYRRAVRLYALVPLGSLLFLLLFAFLPALIQPASLPHSPSAGRSALAVLLSAAMWCLAHSLRVPLYDLLSKFFTSLATVFYKQKRKDDECAKYVPTLTTLVHAVLLAAFQESLRLASFAIFDLRWHQRLSLPGNSHTSAGKRAPDAVFREVWALAFGWALAEVCAGVLQGYEQLVLYSDAAPYEYAASPSDGTDPEGVGHEPYESFDEEGEEGDARSFVRNSIWLSDVDNAKATALQDDGVDAALSRLANIKAREELEELYGEPYINIAVFIPLLQRLDSLLLSLGITLILAAAYLPPPPPAPSSLFIPLQRSSATIHHFTALSHILLVPTFVLVTLIHAILGILHAPPALARIGLPAAAYASCMIGLALAFGGVGVWVGVW